jgi:4-aminobutyrate aminotransferase-like enzyme
MIVLEHAYHGNTSTLIEISPYKHNGPGGEGPPSWVHTAPLPDLYRGAYKSADPQAGAKYARQVLEIVEGLSARGTGLSAFIAESWPSVAGQIKLPKGYLPAVYETVRAAGGVCIADEVQTGYGRLGAWFWGFEAYRVVPDIVVLGKPIGNGHPLGAVATPEIAASFVTVWNSSAPSAAIRFPVRSGLRCSMSLLKRSCRLTRCASVSIFWAASRS